MFLMTEQQNGIYRTTNWILKDIFISFLISFEETFMRSLVLDVLLSEVIELESA
jgi:hypothetical protein